MTPPSDHILDERAAAVADEYRRRKATSVLAVVFTDIAGSTELREQLGEIIYEKHRESHDETVRGLVESGDAGVVVKGTGDGALAVFSEPSTAVLRCLEVQDTIASDPHFRLRIGIDMGQVSVTSQGGIVTDVFGRHVNRAARIQSLAQPSHILTSFQVYDCAVGWLTGTNVRWHNHGMAVLKGFAEKVSVHEPFDGTSMSPQTLPPQDGNDRTKDSGRKFPLPTMKDIRIRPLSFVPKGDPFSFYAQAIALSAGRLSSTRQQAVTILWVDDVPNNNAGESQLLGAAGCRIDLALSTSEAIRKLSANRYSIVITDIGREDNPIAGLELLEWIQNREISIPTIVYCSSRGAATYGTDSIEKGAALCTAGVVSLLDGILQVIEQLWYFSP